MKTQLIMGHVEMKRQTAEEVKSAVVGLKTDLARAECDRQHFVNSVAKALNDVFES